MNGTEGGVCAYTVMTHTERQVTRVKIILVRSPGLLSPLLRRIFGIQKEPSRKKHPR